MRIWHIDLIDVLPRQQLLGQWRELNSIFKKQDKHILINYVYEYDKRDLDVYSLYIIQEMYNRGYKLNLENYCNYFYGEYNLHLVADVMYEIASSDIFEAYSKPFYEHHNQEYLTICYYNLKEKYLCGGITEEEWKKVDEKYKRLVNEKYKKIAELEKQLKETKAEYKKLLDDKFETTKEKFEWKGYAHTLEYKLKELPKNIIQEIEIQLGYRIDNKIRVIADGMIGDKTVLSILNEILKKYGG